MDIARVRSVKKNRRESPRVPIPLSQSKFIARWRVSHREKKISADSANGSNRQAAKQFGNPCAKDGIGYTIQKRKQNQSLTLNVTDHLILNMISSEQLTLKVREKKPAQKNKETKPEQLKFSKTYMSK
jgi:hypothetical protein